LSLCCVLRPCGSRYSLLPLLRCVECGCFDILRLPQQVVLHEPWVAARDVLQRLPCVLDLLVIATHQLLPLDLIYWSAKTFFIVNDVVDDEVNICSACTEIRVFIPVGVRLFGPSPWALKEAGRLSLGPISAVGSFDNTVTEWRDEAMLPKWRYL